MVSRGINDKFDEWSLRGVIISQVLWTRKIYLLKFYHESNLSLIPRETMRLLVSLFHSRYSLKAFLLNKSIIKNLKVLPQVHCIVFFFRRQKAKA